MIEDGTLEQVVDAQNEGMDLTLQKILFPKKQQSSSESNSNRSSLNVSLSESVSSAVTSEASSPTKPGMVSKLDMIKSRHQSNLTEDVILGELEIEGDDESDSMSDWSRSGSIRFKPDEIIK